MAQLRVLGGAMARAPTDATAFAHRSKPMLVNAAAFYEGEVNLEVCRAWVTEFAKAIQPRDDGVCVRFHGDDGHPRIRSAYRDETWDRLVRITSTYDPTTLFRLDQNISPALGQSLKPVP